jgi:hypothetical protein
MRIIPNRLTTTFCERHESLWKPMELGGTQFLLKSVNRVSSKYFRVI